MTLDSVLSVSPETFATVFITVSDCTNESLIFTSLTTGGLSSTVISVVDVFRLSALSVALSLNVQVLVVSSWQPNVAGVLFNEKPLLTLFISIPFSSTVSRLGSLTFAVTLILSSLLEVWKEALVVRLAIEGFTSSISMNVCSESFRLPALSSTSRL